MYAVPDHTKETLLDIIKTCVGPGTTVYSDKWKSYEEIPDLEGYDFLHYTLYR